MCQGQQCEHRTVVSQRKHASAAAAGQQSLRPGFSRAHNAVLRLQYSRWVANADETREFGGMRCSSSPDLDFWLEATCSTQAKLRCIHDHHRSFAHDPSVSADTSNLDWQSHSLPSSKRVSRRGLLVGIQHYNSLQSSTNRRPFTGD